MTDPPHEAFDDTVDALLRPIPPPPSATLRVADLYCGDGELGQLGQLGQAAKDAGLDVVYTREPEIPTEHLDFELIPPFDFLTASLPYADNERKEAVEFVLRFLRVRRPAAFLLMHDRNGDGFLPFIRGKTRRLRYRVSNVGQNGHIFIAGALRAPPVFLADSGGLFEDRPPTVRTDTSAGVRTEPLALPPPVQSAIEKIVRNLN